MQPLPKNVSITGLSIVLSLQLYQNPKMTSYLPTISFPQCQSSTNAGGSHGGNHCHRDKLQDQSELMCFHFSNALVARPVGQKEINDTPAAQAAPDKEWKLTPPCRRPPGRSGSNNVPGAAKRGFEG